MLIIRAMSLMPTFVNTVVVYVLCCTMLFSSVMRFSFHGVLFLVEVVVVTAFL